MTISTLHSTIQHLASQFASGVLDAIRGASLEEILSETSGRPGRRPGRPLSGGGAPSVGSTRRKSGRLPRRSQSDIAAVVDSIVSLLASKPKGLRAEQIRAELGLEAKELPRPISEALKSHKISKKGQKRATTYFAGGKGRPTAPKAGRSARKASAKSSKRSKARGGKRGAKKGASAGGTHVNGVSAAA
jgi:hypothetical protein